MREARAVAAILLTALGATIAGSAATASARAQGQEAGPADSSADVLVLKDGRRLEGRVLAETDDAVTFRSGGTTRLYERGDVDRIVRSAQPDAAAPSAAGAPQDGAAAPGAAATPPGRPADKKRGATGKKGKVLTDAARNWVRDLARTAEIEDDQVRNSVAAALRALGPAAAPAILGAADGAATPSAKEFLLRVAGELSGRRKDGAKSPESPDGAAREGTDDPGMQGPGTKVPPAPPAADPPAPGDAAPTPGAAKPGAPDGRRPLRAAVEKLTADLELRSDQQPRMADLLAALERGQFGILREMKQGGLAADAVAARIDALRTDTLTGAKAFLDVPQYDLFEERAQRYFDGLLLRATRGEGRPAAPEAPAKPGPGE